jgi:hypothetical protein
MMTRKDYVATAEILNNWYFNHPINEHDFADLVGEFSLMFEEDNPNFKADKFEEACYNDAE